VSAAAPLRPAATAPAPWSGLLAIDKPAGVTSHDVVEKVRRRLHVRGAGHLGTLDPGASGLLLLALGAATRCAPVWQGGEKTYEGTLTLGIVTSTQDLHGEVLERRPVAVDETALRAASPALVGDLEQVPPMVSAIKMGGERLYRRARRGEVVERAPRPIHVGEWTWLGMALPEASFRIRCSGGTYVRTLVHDLGARLGCGAALRTLRRLRSEPYGLERAATLRDLDERSADEVLAAAGVVLDRALDVLPSLALDGAGAALIGHGQRPALARAAALAARIPVAAGPRSVVARDQGGRALALGELAADAADPDRLRFCPHVVFPWAVRQGRW
jgi:tRNA pseudouridine55 synthase